MTGDAKVMLGIGLITLLIFVGGIVLLARKDNISQVSQNVDQSVLVRDDSYRIQAQDERVVLVEFTDFQCPFCAQAHPVVNQLLATHPENLTFIVRHFPLSQHQHGVLAAEAAEAAGDQGKFWEMYDLIYANQANWESVGGAEARSMFVGLAEQLELNLDQFNTALDNHTFRDKILRDVADGNAANVTGTPTFYVDGAKFTGSLQNLVTLIEARIQSAEEGEGAEREESMEPVGEVGLEE